MLSDGVKGNECVASFASILCMAAEVLSRSDFGVRIKVKDLDLRIIPVRDH